MLSFRQSRIRRSVRSRRWSGRTAAAFYGLNYACDFNPLALSRGRFMPSLFFDSWLSECQDTRLNNSWGTRGSRQKRDFHSHYSGRIKKLPVAIAFCQGEPDAPAMARTRTSFVYQRDLSGRSLNDLMAAPSGIRWGILSSLMVAPT
jgi:hypothetical protein